MEGEQALSTGRPPASGGSPLTAGSKVSDPSGREERERTPPKEW